MSLEVRAGEFVSMVGPSGCGKSTLLGMISGLLPASAGRILVEGEEMAGINKKLGYLFQRDALLPWKTILDNVALPLLFRGREVRAARARAREWIQRVGLAGFMENELLDIWAQERKTVLFITHDLEEAIALSDRVIVLTASPGRVKGAYEIPLGRPRSVTEVRFHPAFGPLYEAMWKDLKDEVRISYAT